MEAYYSACKGADVIRALRLSHSPFNEWVLAASVYCKGDLISNRITDQAVFLQYGIVHQILKKELHHAVES